MTSFWSKENFAKIKLPNEQAFYDDDRKRWNVTFGRRTLA